MATTNISKKRKFVADGVFYAELNEVRLSLVPVHWCFLLAAAPGPRQQAYLLPT